MKGLGAVAGWRMRPLSIWIGFGVHIEPSTITTRGVEAMADNPQEMMKRYPVASHHEVKETFADQIGSTMFDGSSLRIEFLVVRMNEPMGPGAAPIGERHVVSRLVLSMSGAIDLINQVSKLAGQLTQAGVLKMEQGQVMQQARSN